MQPAYRASTLAVDPGCTTGWVRCAKALRFDPEPLGAGPMPGFGPGAHPGLLPGTGNPQVLVAGVPVTAMSPQRTGMGQMMPSQRLSLYLALF